MCFCTLRGTTCRVRLGGSGDTARSGMRYSVMGAGGGRESSGRGGNGVPEVIGVAGVAGVLGEAKTE